MKKEYNLIVAIVNKGYSDFVIEASKNAGAKGATILNARGSRNELDPKVFGFSVPPEKEFVMILALREKSAKIIKAISKESNLNKEGKGICFSLPVKDVAGISHLYKEEYKDEE